MFPKYTVLFSPWPPAAARLVSASGENGMYGVSGLANGFPPADTGLSALCATRLCAAAACAACAAACCDLGMYAQRSLP